MPGTVVGIMGPGSDATEADLLRSYEIGKASADRGYVVLTGGRKSGVMETGLKGAKDAGGLTIGVLPFQQKSDATDYADVAIVTAMGSARNNINILSSDVVVACGVEAGTLSEIAMALKADKKVILLTDNHKAVEFLVELGRGKLVYSENVEDAMTEVQKTLEGIVE